MGNDTGAREPDGSLMFRDESRDTVTNEERLRARVRFLLAEVSAMPDWMRDEFLSGLAAGVGVPPDAASGCAPAKERQDARATPDFGRWFKESATWTGSDYLWLNRFRDLYLASGASAAEGRLPNTAENSAAGVGEARPAEPGEEA